MWRLVTSTMMATERRWRSICKARCCWRLSTCGLQLKLLRLLQCRRSTAEKLISIIIRRQQLRRPLPNLTLRPRTYWKELMEVCKIIGF